MTDGLTERYGDLLDGGYDCPDRIVLSAYHPLLHGPGGSGIGSGGATTGLTSSWTTPT